MLPSDTYCSYSDEEEQRKHCQVSILHLLQMPEHCWFVKGHAILPSDIYCSYSDEEEENKHCLKNVSLRCVG